MKIVVEAVKLPVAGGRHVVIFIDIVKVPVAGGTGCRDIVHIGLVPCHSFPQRSLVALPVFFLK